MKKFLSLLLAGVLCVATLTACSKNGSDTPNNGDDGSGSGEVITLKVGHDAAETVPIAIGLAEFERLVEERTNGAVQVEVYNNGTMGSASDYVVNCQLGTLDMGTSNQSVVSSFIPELVACDIPYIFESYEHADAAFKGELYDYFAQQVRDNMQLELLAIWEVGFRNLTNSKHPVNSVADVAGLRLRTMDNPVHIEFWQSLGADPVPMSWGEAYTAMQQKAIDGQENPLVYSYFSDFTDVAPYISIWRYAYDAHPFMLSESLWNKLTAEEQQLFVEVSDEWIGVQRQMMREAYDGAYQSCLDEGCTIVELTDDEIATFKAEADKTSAPYIEELSVAWELLQKCDPKK